MKRRVASLIALAIIAAEAHGTDASAPSVFAVELEPGKMHEECIRLEQGDKRRYYWKSTAPVDFNIHHHRGDEVFYPVKRERMRGDGGSFTAKAGDDYCWMWS